MPAICKFKCHTVKDVRQQYSKNTEVSLGTVCGQGEENKAFWEATPMGQIELAITNPKAAEFFEPGQEYYVTFTKAE